MKTYHLNSLANLHSSNRSIKFCLALILATLGILSVCRADENRYLSPNLLTVAGGNFANADDALSGDLDIGFTFTFGGSNYTKVKMSSNGILAFGGIGSEYSNTDLSSRLNKVGVYALWDDLFVGNGTDETLSRALYYTVGAPGSRVFIMQWGNWYSYN